MKKELLTISHYLVTLFIVSMIFWPISILKYIYWLPIVLYMIWLIFGACPLTELTNGNKEESFLHEVYQKICPEISLKQSNDITYLLFVTIIIITSGRVILSIYLKN